MSERSESDRLQQESWFQSMIRRPEIGSFIVMMIIIVSLGVASDGKAFNALGLKKQRRNYRSVRHYCRGCRFINDCWRI